MIPDRKPDYQFSIAGKCVPKARPRLSKGRVHMPKKYVAYKRWAASVARLHIKEPTPENVALSIEFKFENRRWGDVDNLAGSIMDALNGVAYVDDRQVTSLQCSKDIYYYACEAEGKDIPFPASTRVRIWILGGE